MQRRTRRKIRRYTALFSIVFLGTLVIGGVCLFVAFVGKRVVGMKDNDSIQVQADIETQAVPLGDQVEEHPEDSMVMTEGVCDLATQNTDIDDSFLEHDNVYVKEAVSSEEITLVFGGDLLLDDSYTVMSKLKQRGGMVEEAFESTLLEYMRSADVCMMNNEFTFTTGGEPTPEKLYTFRSNPENVYLLQDMGVDIVSLANNHAYDFGEVSIIDTMTTLKNAGIPYVGAGFNIEEAMKPIYYVIGDTRIAIVSATQIEQYDNPDTKGATETSPGVFRCWNDDTVLQVLTEAKENSDFVIFYVHWGKESTTELHWAQTDYAKKYVEAGADVIIGDHPHILQKIDIVEGTPVIYSVGNFWFNSKQNDTCLIEVKIDQNGLKSFRFVPCLQSDCRTSMLDGEEKQRVIRYMNSLSANKLDENGFLIME